MLLLGPYPGIRGPMPKQAPVIAAALCAPVTTHNILKLYRLCG